MKETDFTEFKNLIVDTYNVFNKSVTDGAVKIMFTALREYEYAEIGSAIMYSLKTSAYPPTVASIVTIVKKQRGEDEESLKARAEKFYNAISYNLDSGCDYVCDDPRAVHAFRLCFGSLREFGQHSTASDVFDRKAFVEAYINARNFGKEYVIKGSQHFTDSPRVRFIGCKNDCARIAKSFYLACNKKPRLPDDRPLQLPNIKRAITASFSEDCNPILKMSIEQVLKELTGGK